MSFDAPLAGAKRAGGGFPATWDADARSRHWHELWQDLERPASWALCGQLEAAWSEPQRHYHDLRHLGECLALWQRWQALCARPIEVALALWFHDAVYEPRATDNEARSAAWAARSLAETGVDGEACQRVYDLVMVTRHDAAPTTPDAQLLVDIDLAILGSPTQRFEAYDRDVRKEYAWAAGHIYRSRRTQVLQSFLDRPRLYQSAPAVALLEAQARLNLVAAISRLDQ